MIVAILFGVWLLSSIGVQFYQTALARWMKNLDLFNVLPTWTFFAPLPVSLNLALLVRTKNEVSELPSVWIAVAQAESGNRFLRLIWNPYSRFNKILHDFGQEIADLTDRSGQSAPQIELSFPYLSLLSYAQGSVRGDTAEAIQFGLLEYTDFDPDIEIGGFVLVSGYHIIERQSSGSFR